MAPSLSQGSQRAASSGAGARAVTSEQRAEPAARQEQRQEQQQAQKNAQQQKQKEQVRALQCCHRRRLRRRSRAVRAVSLLAGSQTFRLPCRRRRLMR